jgi:trimeric autotransporter adhesin
VCWPKHPFEIRTIEEEKVEMKRYALIVLPVVLALLLVVAVGALAQGSLPPDAQLPQGPLPPGPQAEQVPPGSQAAQVVQEPLAPTGSSFTYQGRLTRNGQPLTETCALSISVWDAETGGSFLNSNTFNSVQVEGGLFTVPLDYGDQTFKGEARWLESAVRCTSDSNYVTLTPRTRLRVAPYAQYALNNWAIGGNPSTLGNGYLGTTDNMTFTIGVGSRPALRIFPRQQSPNMIGGYEGNYTTAAAYGGTIAGGGAFFYENRVLHEYGTVGGGRKNQSDGYGSTIAGGIDNQAATDYATVAGGLRNYATGSSSAIAGGFYNVASGYVAFVGGGDLNWALTQNATVSGGYSNTVSGGQLVANGTIGGGVFNKVTGFAGVIAGGHGNQATNEWTTIGGGGFNRASAKASTVAGGSYNLATGAGSTVSGGGWNGSVYNGNQARALASTIAGGYGNRISADGYYGSIGGGYSNYITATLGSNLYYGTIAGGINNKVNLGGATVGGGNTNTASGFDATVAGGNNNTASGAGAAIPGGNSNLAQGVFSFAGGYRAKAYNNGCFAWNDNTDADLVCNTNNTFVVRSTGGVIFGTNTALSTGCSISAGGGGWSCTSDRNTKTGFAPVDTRQILQALNTIPIESWSFKTEDPAVRHIGPMAQDFKAAFGVGSDEKHINSLDADGVALAAIQGLYKITQDQGAQITQQQGQIAGLQEQVSTLEKRLDALEKNQVAKSSFLPLNPLILLGLVLAGGFAWLFHWVSNRKHILNMGEKR